jgi:acyl-CoA synthetase (AMP-forming)/AMP-acid ligase II
MLPEGGTVLLLLPHSPELFLLHFGLILKGRLPGILAWPTSRIDPEKYQRNLAHQLRNLPAHQLITLPQLAANLRSTLPFEVTACEVENSESFEKNLAVPIDLPPAEVSIGTSSTDVPADALFLQFSGGTTGAQKAVVVTAPMHVAQLKRLRERLAFSAGDAVVSWLPMYHDMGLIAALWFPLWHGAASLQFSATDWLLNPEMLFFYMDRYRGTFCWLPNFAFSYLAARRSSMQGGHSLSHLRGWINCSEPVRLRSTHDFLEAFGPWGVSPNSLQSCYAMAENVFAVTQTSLDEPAPTFPRSQVRRLNSLYSELPCQILDDVYVSSGRPIQGAQVRIVNQNVPCAPVEPGEIQIRTESLFSGYWGSDGFLTSSLSLDGWYSTGDYGFLIEKQLFVIGRMKDIVIVGGQNIFPEDVEAVVNTVNGIYPGRVVAFGVLQEEYGTESLAVVAEMRGDFDKRRAGEMQRAIQKLVLSTIGVAPRFALVVPERWIVKSTAGKISRRETKQRFAKEILNLDKPAVVPPAGPTIVEGTHA